MFVAITVLLAAGARVTRERTCAMHSSYSTQGKMSIGMHVRKGVHTVNDGTLHHLHLEDLLISFRARRTALRSLRSRLGTRQGDSEEYPDRL